MLRENARGYEQRSLLESGSATLGTDGFVVRDPAGFFGLQDVSVSEARAASSDAELRQRPDTSPLIHAGVSDSIYVDQAEEVGRNR
jgi:hypothetical protein